MTDQELEELRLGFLLLAEVVRVHWRAMPTFWRRRRIVPSRVEKRFISARGTMRVSLRAVA